MLKKAMTGALALGLCAPAAAAQAQPAQQQAQAAAPLQLWRLDCGEFPIKQYGAFFSDTFQYPAGPKTIVGSCYLMRHGDLSHWLTRPGRLEPVTGDHDVFGDGRVMMLTMPGHAPGHYALLVQLASGPVLPTGDLYHFTEQVANRGVPPFNVDRADTLAFMDRFDRMVRNLGARVIIQHEPADIAKLPAFPEAAR